MPRSSLQRKRRHNHSVYALIAGALVQAFGGAWETVPGALIDQMPRWVPFAVSGLIFAYGLWGAWAQQRAEE
jgi:hypothetical protein